MKVAIVHDLLIKLGGAERVLSSLLEIYPTAEIFTLLYDAKGTESIFEKHKINESYLAKLPTFLKKRHKFLFPYMPSAIEKFDFTGFDLVISSSNSYAHGVITPSDAKHIVYSHSPMRYAWDYTHKYFAEQNSSSIFKAFGRILLRDLRVWDFLASKRSNSIIANSKTVQSRISKFYRRTSKVIYPPVDLSRFKVTEGHQDFYLIVSTLTPYKKIDLAIKLFNKINKKLIIIGDGPARKSLQSISNENVDFLGRRSDKETAEYMQNCRALIFPGEEDFGITPIEAMACGKPVLAYRKGGLTETVIEGKTGEFFNTQEVDAMEDALGRMILNEKFYKCKEIRENANRFSKEIFQKEIKKLIKEECR